MHCWADSGTVFGELVLLQQPGCFEQLCAALCLPACTRAQQSVRLLQMEPLYDDMRTAALEYAKAINVFAADLTQQVHEHRGFATLRCTCAPCAVTLWF